MKKILSKLIFLMFISAGAVTVLAQGLSPHNREMFKAMDLPPANSIRNGAGEPGVDYWQQRADYNIKVALNGDDHRITGSEVIHYTNNSPDNLRYLWMQMEQNLFRPGSKGNLINSNNRWAGGFDGGGLDMTKITITMNGETYTPSYVIDDTRMRIDLNEALAAGGGTVDINVEWTFIVPPYGADRMGRFEAEKGIVYEVAQWYPRMYVYDDIHGWNPLPYIGQGEFYREFGDYNLEITTPASMTVIATGELLNPEEVLTGKQQERLEKARTSAETVHIITPNEVGLPQTHKSGSETLTWKFKASNVHDAAWAASSAFIWDAAGWEDVLIQSVYPHEGLGDDGNPGWESSTQYTRHTIQFYSDNLYRYPWPVAINVAGIVGGMEYPMVSFCGVNARDQGLFGVTDHEFGHNWFPMIVSSDERRYAWMDEGFNTYINYYSNYKYYGANSTRIQRVSSQYVANQMQSQFADQPMMSAPDQIRRNALGFLAYRKPGYGLKLLREYVIGEERFDKAFQTYVERWAYKHPQPADFYRTIEDVTGEDLSWFWRGWMYTTDKLDQAALGARLQDGYSEIAIQNIEGLVMPATVQVTYEDGTSKRIDLPVEIWMTTDTFVLKAAGDQRIVKLELDPAGVLPDVNLENNTWKYQEEETTLEPADG